MEFQDKAYRRAKSREGAESGAGVWDFMAGHDWTVAQLRNAASGLKVSAGDESANFWKRQAKDYEALTDDMEKRIAELEREIKYLRTYGIKDALAMADEAQAKATLEVE